MIIADYFVFKWRRKLFTSPHKKAIDRSDEISHFFQTEVNKSEEANPSREGKIRLGTSLARIYETKYKEYCKDLGHTPMKMNKFYAVRKKCCPEVQRSKEFRKSMRLFMKSHLLWS